MDVRVLFADFHGFGLGYLAFSEVSAIISDSSTDLGAGGMCATKNKFEVFRLFKGRGFVGPTKKTWEFEVVLLC